MGWALPNEGGMGRPGDGRTQGGRESEEPPVSPLLFFFGDSFRLYSHLYLSFPFEVPSTGHRKKVLVLGQSRYSTTN